MTDSNTEQYYSERAPEYEQIYYRDVPDRRKEIDDEVVRLRDLAAGKTVLDLACGTGYWTKVIAESASSVLATDVSGEMITEARKKDYVAPVKFVQADMFANQFERKFDLVSSGFWFSHHPRQDYGKFFDVLRRPLLDGGRIWMIENNPPAEGPKMESARTDEHGNNYKRRYLDSGREFVILKNYFEKQELEEIFSPEFEIERLTYGRFYWSLVMKPRK